MTDKTKSTEDLRAALVEVGRKLWPIENVVPIAKEALEIVTVALGYADLIPSPPQHIGRSSDADGVDLREAIRSLPYNVDDDYDEVRRDERERIITALAVVPAVKKSVSPDECRRDLQALGAAISRRCWQSAESAYNALRDRIGQ